VSANLDDAVAAVQASSAARYTDGAVLGVGGMGKVVISHDARIGRDVALKVIHSRREILPSDRARFIREAQVQGQLEHPSIVPVYDIDVRSDGSVFFTMRRVLGRTLHAIVEEVRSGDLAAQARFTQRELLTAFATVCLTIDYAHSHGVIHRDLKPANIMLGDFGEVYVLDWGVARVVAQDAATPDPEAPSLSKPGELLGTPMYMAPEQFVDSEVGPSADVFALGAILFELLALEPLRDPRAPYVPFEPRPSRRAPDRVIAPELDAICAQATELDPARRFLSPRALHQAVWRYLEGDRELAQRRARAAEHAAAARVALAKSDVPGAESEVQRGVAMRELARALALDPTDDANVTMFSEILDTPPREIPQEARAEIDREDHQLLRTSARQLILSILAWFAFVPFLMMVGVRSWADVLWIVTPGVLAILLCIRALRAPRITSREQYVAIGLSLLSIAGMSRIYGPLIMMPTFVAIHSIVAQAHPHRDVRRVSAAMSLVAMVVPVLLELTGWLPASYVFAADRWIVVPHLLALPRLGTLVLLVVVDVCVMLVPTMFIARMRADLTDAQTRLHVRAWHFRRVGHELTRG
jgi:eukaryotic-like serine/threonine-protein kinase